MSGSAAHPSTIKRNKAARASTRKARDLVGKPEDKEIMANTTSLLSGQSNQNDQKKAGTQQ
jgi:hypothetical protein